MVIFMIRIYLAGPMTGLSFHDQIDWRNDFTDMIQDRRAVERILVFNPCLAYSPSDNRHKTEKEVMRYEIYNLKKADVVVANLTGQSSIGTCMEVAVAHEHGIPIVGLYKDAEPLHPWLNECCTRVCDSMDELIEYIADYYIY